MHKLIFRLLVFISLAANAVVTQASSISDIDNQTQPQNKTIHILNQRDPICPQIIDVFRAYNKLLLTSKAIPVERLQTILDGSTPTLQECNALAQDKFLRPKGSERLDSTSSTHYATINQDLSPEQKESVLEAFKQMGDIAAILPQYQKYDYIVILGSTIQSMRDRIMFVAGLFKNGQLVPADNTKIVFLTGDRPLFKFETEQVLINSAPYKQNPNWIQPKVIPDNEDNAAEWIYNQLDLPEQMRKVPVEFISSGKRDDQSRAQTSDTIKEWATKSLLSNNTPRLKQILLISSNPFVYYGTITTALTLQKAGINSGYELEGIGLAAEHKKHSIDIALGVLLDNLARTLYTQYEISKLNP